MILFTCIDCIWFGLLIAIVLHLKLSIIFFAAKSIGGMFQGFNLTLIDSSFF